MAAPRAGPDEPVEAPWKCPWSTGRNNEPGAEDGDAGAEKRAEGDQDEDAGVVVSCAEISPSTAAAEPPFLEELRVVRDAMSLCLANRTH